MLENLDRLKLMVKFAVILMVILTLKILQGGKKSK